MIGQAVSCSGGWLVGGAVDWADGWWVEPLLNKWLVGWAAVGHLDGRMVS